jgi:hypothetical protein
VDDFGGWKLENDGTQAVSREMFVLPLIKAVQEQQEMIDTLKARIAALENN